MDKSDACHFKELLQRQNKMVATGHHSFLLYCPTDGQHIVLSVFQLPNHRKNITLVMLSYGLHLCQLAQEVRRADQGTVFVSWPGVRTFFGNNAVASDEWNTTDHSITQMMTETLEKGRCLSGIEGGSSTCSSAKTAVWKPNLSPESKPIQFVLLQYLCLSVTPHEYLILGEGGTRRNYRQLYCSVHIPLYISLPVFQNHLSGSLSCVQLYCHNSHSPPFPCHTSFRRQKLGEKGYMPLALPFTWYSQN